MAGGEAAVVVVGVAEEVELRPHHPLVPSQQLQALHASGALNIPIFRLGTGRGVAYISDGGGALISVLNLRHVHGKTFSLQSQEIIEKLTNSVPTIIVTE